MSVQTSDLETTNVDLPQVPVDVEVAKPRMVSKRPVNSARPENAKRARQENAYKVM